MYLDLFMKERKREKEKYNFTIHGLSFWQHLLSKCITSISTCINIQCGSSEKQFPYGCKSSTVECVALGWVFVSKHYKINSRIKKNIFLL